MLNNLGFPHLFRGSQGFPQLQGDARSDFDHSALGVGSQGHIDDGNGWVAGVAGMMTP